MNQGEPIPAGTFSDWLLESIDLISTGAPVNVPCGSCTACCRSSLILPVFAEEKDALASIPNEHFLDTPFIVDGVKFIDFGEEGCCPMLVGGKCSIYPDRPHACRAYDCRVLSATGIAFSDDSDLSQRVQAWQFDFPSSEDRALYEAVQAAASFLQERVDHFPDRLVGDTPRQVAIRAILVYELFLDEKNKNWLILDRLGTEELAQAIIKLLEQVETRQIVVENQDPGQQ